MVKVNDKVISIIERVRKIIREKRMAPELFPIDDIYGLIEDTLGEPFWKCVGSDAGNYGFGNMPELYKELLENALKKEDMEECERILYLYECTYKAFYSALDEEERIFRQKPYRQMIIDLGNANAQMQYRIHEERQKALPESEKRELAKGKGVVYTCLTGEQILKQPEEVSVNLDYLCFTDIEEKWGTREGVWRYCQVEKKDCKGVPSWESRYRIMAHEILEDYDYSIWIDSDVVIKGDVIRFCEVYGKGRGFLAFSSAKDGCLYEDMSITNMSTDDLNVKVRKNMKRYQKEGYPKNNGLIDMRVMARSHRDEAVCRMMEAWWQEIEQEAACIENIFNYIAWKYQFPFSVCDLFVYENPYFRISDIDLDTNDML